MKRLICMLLCIAMVLPLAACGKTGTEPTTANMPGVTSPAETVDPVEAALTVARGLIDAGDLDAAEAVLAQVGEDVRVAALLDEIDSLRVIDLDVTTDLIYHTGNPETLIVHGMTAQEFSDGMVRFTFDFTAPEGTPLKVIGSYLGYFDHAPATGEREQFVFEIAAADIRRIGSKFTIEFGSGSVSMLTVDVTVAWPGEGTAGVSDLPLLSDGQPMGEAVELTVEAPEGVTVQSFTRQWLDNQCYRYTLDMSAPQGQTVAVTNTDGLVYHEPVPADGPIVFDLPWSVASVYPEILVEFPDAPEYAFTAYNGYLVTGETPVSDGRPLDYSETTDYDNTHGRMEILSATAWDLTHDFVRYEVVFSAQEEVRADAYYHEAVTDEVIPRFSMKTAAVFPSGQQTLTFDLRREDAAGAGHPAVCFQNEDGLFYFIPLFDPLTLNLTEGKPVGEEIALKPTVGNSFRSKNDVKVHTMAAQLLDNDQVRFNITYAAPAGIATNGYCSYVGGVESHFAITKGSGSETFTFDVELAHLQDELDLVVMFYDWDNGLFVTPWGYLLKELSLPQKAIEPVSLTVIDDPSKPRTLPFAGSLDDLAITLEQKAGELTPQPGFDREAALAVDTSMVTPLEVSRKMVEPKGQDGIEPYAVDWLKSLPKDADLSDNLPLAYAIKFADTTDFAAKMPPAFDPQALLEWGKDPGLNVDVLHELGYTGKGAVVAYIDQEIGHPENIAGGPVHYFSDTNNPNSMHGPAVLSLLSGPEIGIAPDAEVYFYGTSDTSRTNNECNAANLRRLLEQNQTLPQDKKITMVGFSDHIREGQSGEDELLEAIAACEADGIMVWFCTDYFSASWYPMSDKNNWDNVISDVWSEGMTPNLVFVPAGGRTTANEAGSDYIYWPTGGVSWTMPYMLGLYAIVTGIDPSLSQTDLRAMVVETAYEKDGMKIVNPIEFVATALEGAGKHTEAAALRQAAEDDHKYFYGVMNKSAMTEEDLAGAEKYLSSITDATVLMVDASGAKTAQELYTILQADHVQRGGQVTGVQILGDPTLVPTFEAGYKVQMFDGVDEMGSLLTDLFYGNFDNRASDLTKDYNVLDHFAEDWSIRLTPQWKVARLPLAAGEFGDFFEKYEAFAQQGGLNRMPFTSFSNPIFHNARHVEDPNVLMNRMRDEWGLLDIPYTLYGNLDGLYPVLDEVEGNFTTENLKAVNESGIREILVSSHGQMNNIDHYYIENGKEIRESLVNSENISQVLGSNPYYLDCWTCNNGETMQNNLTTAALKGQAMGVFSATGAISNNGVNCYASLDTMPQSNFMYFYLTYLASCSQGADRSDAFFTAQKRYAEALIIDSAAPVRADGNYQFNLMNLLSYHNFGLIEPSKAAPCMETDLK